MNELLLKRIERRLANLADAQGYQVLDYVEFLESKYGTGERPATPLERIADGVENVLRAGRIPAAAIRGTMGAVDSASRLMDRLAQAGRSAVAELNKSLTAPPSPPSSPPSTPAEPPPPAEGAAPPEEPPASA
ncbi:MAG TPA: hypothetical protein VFH97_06345 [Gemmatimonadales bacterium]|jgi:hypothetical protein|nr:hypothetical protein [Gemmatimonadales bacterium]